MKKLILILLLSTNAYLFSENLNILAVMTGTSCDALDCTCMKFSQDGFKTLWSDSRPYPNDLKNKIFELQKPNTTVTLKTILEINRDLGEWYGKTLSQIILEHEARPDCIANHGQTVAHFPQEGRQGITMQLGDPTRIAYLTGITVISNFREGDQAGGGQGAPLAPLYHKLIAKKLSSKGLSIHNLGGISNLTYISDDNVMAFDTGPANMLIDAAVTKITNGEKTFDENGLLASQGTVDNDILKKLLEHDFFETKPPKSTGRDDFPPEKFFKATSNLQNNDLVATATELTIESIVQAYRNWIIDKGLNLDTILLCGGGAYNLTILNSLQKKLPSVNVTTFDEIGLDSQYIEAEAFAVLGYYTLMGNRLGGSWTGSDSLAPPGHIIPGQNWNSVVSKIADILG